SGTRQGTYATTADGTFLASWNNNNPRFVAGKLREALAKWERLKAEGRTFAGEDPLDPAQLNRADRFFPEGGLVLRLSRTLRDGHGYNEVLTYVQIQLDVPNGVLACLCLCFFPTRPVSHSGMS